MNISSMLVSGLCGGLLVLLGVILLRNQLINARKSGDATNTIDFFKVAFAGWCMVLFGIVFVGISVGFFPYLKTR